MKSHLMEVHHDHQEDSDWVDLLVDDEYKQQLKKVSIFDFSASFCFSRIMTHRSWPDSQGTENSKNSAFSVHWQSLKKN